MELSHLYAGEIREALKGAVDVRKVAEAWAALHPKEFTSKAAGPEYSAFLARWASAIRDALGGVLRKLWPEGWTLGQQAAKALAADAEVTWEGWAPGDYEAALQVAEGGLEWLLGQQDVTIKSIAASRLEELGNVLAEFIASESTSRPLLPAELPPEYSVGALADALEGVLDNPERALMVAQTEVARASSAASSSVFRRLGLTQVEVSTAGDRRVCVKCQQAEAAGPVSIGTYSLPLHPLCFPAGTLVSGPPAVAATGRHYEGDLVTIVFAHGEDVAVTPNHPVLTPRGWVAAGELQEGDDVFRARDGVEAALACPDYEQVVTLIEEVAAALAEAGGVASVRVPVAAEDFHGDGLGSAGHDVDVVATARHAVGDADAPGGDGRAERQLIGRPGAAVFGVGDGHAPGIGLDGSPVSGVGSVEQRGPLGVTGLLPAQQHRLGAVAAVDASLPQHAVHGAAVDAMPGGEGLDGLAAQEVRDQSVRGGVQPPVLEDASLADLAVGDGQGDAGDGRALADALAGTVSLDQVRDLRRVSWSGHVYNLETVDGWYFANGIIAHNCRCALIPVIPVGQALAALAGAL